MISQVDNLLLNETDEIKSSFLIVKSKLREHNIILGKSNEALMFANHIIMLIKRLEEGASLPEYYYDDESEVKSISRRSIAIAEDCLNGLFEKYSTEMVYSEIILCGMYIELLLKGEVFSE